MIKHFYSLLLLLFTAVFANAQSLLSPANDKLFTSISSPDESLAAEKGYLTDTSLHLNDTLKLPHQLRMIAAYQLKQLPDSAWLILKATQKLLTSVHTTQCSDLDYWWIAKTYLQQKQIDKAKFWISLALIRLQNSGAIELRKAYSIAASELAQQTSDFKNAIVYQALADSLSMLQLQDNFRMQQDSASAAMNLLNDSINAKNKFISAKEQEHKENFKLWLIANAIVIFLLLGLVIFLFIRGSRRKNKSEINEKSVIVKEETTNNLPSSRVQTDKINSDITNIYGLTSLMLEKPRTGEDLNYLKSIQSESLEWFNLLKSEQKFIEPLDEDVIIRKLKGIRIIIYTTNNYTALFLRDYLRKKIRLCTINVVNRLNGIDNTQSDVLIADDAKTNLPEAELIPVIYLNSSNEYVKGISKPFVIDELIRRLIHIYEPQHSYQTDAVQEITNEISEAAVLSPTQELLVKLNEARDAKDKNRIIEIVAQLKPLIEQDTNVKWFDSVLNHGNELSELQFEIAIRNIVTYISKQS